MSTQNMDVFSLRDTVVDEYRNFATSFTTIFGDDIRQQVEAIYARNRYWPEPLIQINPSYRRTTTVQQLVDAGTLEPPCAQISRTPPTANAPNGESLSLYGHQEQAVAVAAHGESFAATTGTGSGKSLCFLIPIVNAVLAEKRRASQARTRRSSSTPDGGIDMRCPWPSSTGMGLRASPPPQAVPPLSRAQAQSRSSPPSWENRSTDYGCLASRRYPRSGVARTRRPRSCDASRAGWRAGRLRTPVMCD